MNNPILSPIVEAETSGGPFADVGLSALIFLLVCIAPGQDGRPAEDSGADRLPGGRRIVPDGQLQVVRRGSGHRIATQLNRGVNEGETVVMVRDGSAMGNAIPPLQ
jgi:hypothetical protein